MKRLIIILVAFAIILIGGGNGICADAKLFTLSHTADGGVEYTSHVSGTFASGVSPLYIIPYSGWRSWLSGETTLKRMSEHDGYFTIQASAVTNHSQNQATSTFDLYYKCSLVDDETHWNAANPVAILDDIALTGNTLYEYTFSPDWTYYMRFYFGGTTHYGTVNFRLLVR